MFYAAAKEGRDLEKEAIRRLSSSIKQSHLTDITLIDLIKPGNELFKDIQQIALNIYLKDDYSIKKRIKDVTNLQKKYDLNTLILTYLEMDDELVDLDFKETVLVEAFEEEDLSEDKKDSTLWDFNTSTKRVAKLVVHSICLLSIILNNDLLNYSIEYISENNSDISIIKNFRKEVHYIGNGYCRLPFLIHKNLFTKVANYAVKNGESSGSTIAALINLTYMFQFTAKYFYKDKYLDITNSKLDAEKLLFSIDYYKYFKGNSQEDRAKMFNLTYFKKRKILLPANGVILKNLNPDSTVESILLNEFATDYGLYIIGFVRYKNELEIPIKIPVHIEAPYVLYCPESEEVLNLIQDFYGIEETNSKYEIISPYYWKYRGQNYETSNEKDKRLKGLKVKREHEIKINSFVRKIKGNPSQEALSLARKLYIELEPNTTIVKEHTRVYNKNIEL